MIKFFTPISLDLIHSLSNRWTRESINHLFTCIQCVWNFNLSSCSSKVLPFFLPSFLSTRYHPIPFENAFAQYEDAKRRMVGLEILRVLVKFRSFDQVSIAGAPRGIRKLENRSSDRSPPIWMPIDRSRAVSTPIFRAFVPRSVLPRPLFAFDCELWAIANQDSDYSSKRWMERGNVPLLLLFFARRHGV